MDAGRNVGTRLARPTSQVRTTGTRKKKIIFPVELTTSRTGNLFFTPLIHASTLLDVMNIDYMHDHFAETNLLAGFTVHDAPLRGFGYY